MLQSLCTWLVAMLAPQEHASFVEAHGKVAVQWKLAQLDQLIELYLQSHAESTLATAFFIFQPVSEKLCLKHGVHFRYLKIVIIEFHYFSFLSLCFITSMSYLKCYCFIFSQWDK